MQQLDVVDIFRRRTRSPLRPRSSDIIKAVFDNFRYHSAYHSEALILGEAEEWGQTIFVIGQQKPKPENLRTKEDLAKLNHGMLTADDHAHIWKFMKRAVEYGRQNERPVSIVTLIDTYGADISMESARKFQAFYIAHLIKAFLTVPLPTVSVVIGEGGSGGALAVQVTDRRAQLDDALYATAPPESMAAIVFRDATKIREALAILKPTAAELLELGVIDQVLPAPPQVTDVAGYAKVIGHYLERSLKDITRVKIDRLIRKRRRRAEAFGVSTPKNADYFSWKKWFKLIPLRRKALPAPDLKTFSAVEVNYQPSVDWGEEADLAVLQGEFVKCGDFSQKTENEVGCGTVMPLKIFLDNHYVCPECGRSQIMGAMGWINCLCDSDSFHELHRGLSALDILHPSFLTPEYKAFLTKQTRRSHFKEALVTGEGLIYGQKVALAICEFYFAGGTMGVVFGEKFHRLAEYALQKKMPLVSLCCSGGARLHEGAPALMQMVKTVNAVTRLKRYGLPFISILGDPSTGGAIASYAALGDVVLAEPEALVIFTGPRVMASRGFPVDEKAVRAQSLAGAMPKILADPDFYHDIRGIHETAPRSGMKEAVFKYLEFYTKTQAASNRYWQPPKPFYHDIRGIHETAPRSGMKEAVFKYLEFYTKTQAASNRYWQPPKPF